MDIKKQHWIGIFVGLAVIIGGYFLLNADDFPLSAGLGALIGLGPFVLTIIKEVRIATQKEEKFLEFARNLVESVKTGTPVSKSISAIVAT